MLTNQSLNICISSSFFLSMNNDMCTESTSSIDSLRMMTSQMKHDLKRISFSLLCIIKKYIYSKIVGISANYQRVCLGLSYQTVSASTVLPSSALEAFVAFAPVKLVPANGPPSLNISGCFFMNSSACLGSNCWLPAGFAPA